MADAYPNNPTVPNTDQQKTAAKLNDGCKKKAKQNVWNSNKEINDWVQILLLIYGFLSKHINITTASADG